MNTRLQAGVELILEKTAAEESGAGLLASILHQKAAAAGLTEDQGVEQSRTSVNTTPSSSKGTKMEDKNKGFGKGEEKLDDDPTKGSSAQATGKVSVSTSGKNITTEGSGMPDLSMKKASSSNARIMATMLKAYTR
jgi:hypothetical protein